MSLEITGKVIAVLPEQSGTSAGGKSWTKQDFVIETEDQYPKKIACTAFGEKVVPIASKLTIGQEITVHINIESREFNEKWFTNVSAWRIDLNPNGITNKPVESIHVKTNEEIVSDGDDLPF